jgi:hypothetical protein
LAYLLKARTVKPAETAVAKERLCKHWRCFRDFRDTQQWSNWEAVFSTRSMRLLRDATIETLLGEVFSVRSVPRLYNEEQLRLWESFETAVRRVECWCEMAASLGVCC